MTEVLNNKRQEIIESLISKLSSKNSDYEMALNA